MLSQTLSPSSFPVVVRSHLVVTLLLHCVWSTSESPVTFTGNTRGKSTFGEKVPPRTLNASYTTSLQILKDSDGTSHHTLNVRYAASPQILKDSDGTSHHTLNVRYAASPQILKDSDGTSQQTLNVSYATSQQTLKAGNGTSPQTFNASYWTSTQLLRASYGTSPHICNASCFSAGVGTKTRKVVHRDTPDPDTMSIGETEKVTQVPLDPNSAMVISANLMFERIERSRISKTTSPVKSTKNKSTVTENRISEGTLTTPSNASFTQRETSKEARATEEKELFDILGKSDTQPLTSAGVFGDTALDCMKRNGTLHFKIRKYSNVFISFQVDKRHVGNGQNMFCVIRWHFIGNVGTFFQIWQKDCKKSEDSASVYELNSTLPRYPQIRHLFGICEGSRLKHYYGQTNEMLVFIKTKDAHPFMLFLLEINSRSLESLETRFLSGQEGTNVILARL